LRILSNIAEMEVENHELMRILAHQLEQLGYYELATSVYEEVVKIRAEEPQSFRDLSLCLAAEGQYQKALDIIYEAIKKPWDGRFPEIEGIMAVEMNRIISKAAGKIDISKIDFVDNKKDFDKIIEVIFRSDYPEGLNVVIM